MRLRLRWARVEAEVRAAKGVELGVEVGVGDGLEVEAGVGL